MRLTLAGVIAFFMVVAGSLASFSDAFAIETGMWEMTMETQMEGLPFAMPATVITVKQCVTAKDLVPKDPNQNCTYKNLKKSGNKVSWELECDQDGTKMSGKGNMTYSGSTCSGTSKMVIDAEGTKMTTLTKTKGKRLGKCTGEEDSMSVNGRDVKEMQKETEDMLAMSKMAQAKMQAEMDAEKMRGLKVINAIKIPKEKSDACSHVRNAFSNVPPGACNDKWGDLNIREGEWEITEEHATKQGEMVLAGDDPRVETTCLSPFNEPSYPAKNDNNLKRSGNTVTWNSSSDEYGLKSEVKGGVEFKGDSYEGGTIEKTTTGGMTQVTYKRITARRIGDGSCVGRDGTARKIKSQRKSLNTAAPAAMSDAPAVPTPDDVIQNPVKKFRSLFGF